MRLDLVGRKPIIGRMCIKGGGVIWPKSEQSNIVIYFYTNILSLDNVVGLISFHDGKLRQKSVKFHFIMYTHMLKNIVSYIILIINAPPPPRKFTLTPFFTIFGATLIVHNNFQRLVFKRLLHAFLPHQIFPLYRQIVKGNK